MSSMVLPVLNELGYREGADDFILTPLAILACMCACVCMCACLYIGLVMS